MELTFLIGIAVLVVLAKAFFRGGTCRIQHSLQGKAAIVTGGNTGIGKQTIRDMAKYRCKIIMGARDKIKGEQAVKEIIKQTSNTNIQFISLDLANKKSIQQFAGTVKSKYASIDFLINNAGVMMLPQRTLTKDGFQMQMGTNHLGHFYLTSLLWDNLKNVKGVRIINVSSLAHVLCVPLRRVYMDFGDFMYVKNYNPEMAYSRSKLANVLFTKALAKKLEKVNGSARVVCLHPGVVRTELTRYVLTGIKKLIYKTFEFVYWIFSKSPVEGAQTTLYTVYETTENLKNGEYYSDCKQKKANDEAYKEQNQEKLWTLSEELLKTKFVV